MKTIHVAELNIGISLFFMDEFISLDRYVTEEEPEYFIESKDMKELILPMKSPDVVTTFYDLYFFVDKKIQIQKLNGRITGGMEYIGNKVFIYPYDKSFATEYLLSQYAFLYFISKKGGIIFHGSSFIYEDWGILLTAKSGTGKSTHSKLWQKYDDVVVINDDKNVIYMKDDGLYMYGSPWSGKHMKDSNTYHKLDFIVFLYQNPFNEIRMMSKKEAFLKMLSQVVKPTEDSKEDWNKITDKLLELPSFYFGCNMEYDAYLTLKKEIDSYAAK